MTEEQAYTVGELIKKLSEYPEDYYVTLVTLEGYSPTFAVECDDKFKNVSLEAGL